MFARYKNTRMTDSKTNQKNDDEIILFLQMLREIQGIGWETMKANLNP